MTLDSSHVRNSVGRRLGKSSRYPLDLIHRVHLIHRPGLDEEGKTLLAIDVIRIGYDLPLQTKVVPSDGGGQSAS